MEVTFNQHIANFKNSVPIKICDNIVNLFEENISKTIDRHQEYELYERDTLNIKEENRTFLKYGIREDRSISLDILNPKLDQQLRNFILTQIFPIYVKKYLDVRNFNGFNISDAKVQKTLPSEGYHIWHCEQNYNLPIYLSRVLAWTLYLNDVEEGGETEFLNQSIRVKPTQGTISLFPSYFTHTHRGNPPLSGEKYIITGWIETQLPNE